MASRSRSSAYSPASSFSDLTTRHTCALLVGRPGALLLVSRWVRFGFDVGLDGSAHWWVRPSMSRRMAVMATVHARLSRASPTAGPRGHTGTRRTPCAAESARRVPRALPRVLGEDGLEAAPQVVRGGQALGHVGRERGSQQPWQFVGRIAPGAHPRGSVARRSRAAYISSGRWACLTGGSA